MPPFDFVDHSYPDLAANLAGDEALLLDAEARGGPPRLRIWELDHHAVVLGASCRVAANVREENCAADGVPVGRRSSGGGTVVIGPGTLNVTVVLPIADLPEADRPVDAAQRAVLGRIGAALRAAGPEVAMLGSGDLTLGGRKFSGSAQRRLRHFLMIHASILHDFDLGAIDRYTRMPPRQPEYRAGRAHADFVVNLPLDRASITRAIRSAWPVAAAAEGGGMMPAGLVAGLVREKFGNAGWIGRL